MPAQHVALAPFPADWVEDNFSMSILKVTIVASAAMHDAAGQENPCTSRIVRTATQGLVCQTAQASRTQREAAALTAEAVCAIRLALTGHVTSAKARDMAIMERSGNDVGMTGKARTADFLTGNRGGEVPASRCIRDIDENDDMMNHTQSVRKMRMMRAEQGLCVSIGQPNDMKTQHCNKTDENGQVLSVRPLHSLWQAERHQDGTFQFLPCCGRPGSQRWRR